KRNLELVGVSAIDIVKPDSDLGYHFQRTLPGRENFRVDRVAKSGNQTINSRLYFFDDEGLGWRFRLRINLKVVAFVAKNVNGIADITGGKNAETWTHADVSFLTRNSVTHHARRAIQNHQLLLGALGLSGWLCCHGLGMMTNIRSENPENYV